jgi:hypothetical protein
LKKQVRSKPSFLWRLYQGKKIKISEIRKIVVSIDIIWFGIGERVSPNTLLYSAPIWLAWEKPYFKAISKTVVDTAFSLLQISIQNSERKIDESILLRSYVYI